jgi:hypothetical protein
MKLKFKPGDYVLINVNKILNDRIIYKGSQEELNNFKNKVYKVINPRNYKGNDYNLKGIKNWRFSVDELIPADNKFKKLKEVL